MYINANAPRSKKPPAIPPAIPPVVAAETPEVCTVVVTKAVTVMVGEVELTAGVTVTVTYRLALVSEVVTALLEYD
jgi:hypothetical protein